MVHVFLKIITYLCMLIGNQVRMGHRLHDLVHFKSTSGNNMEVLIK